MSQEHLSQPPVPGAQYANDSAQYYDSPDALQSASGSESYSKKRISSPAPSDKRRNKLGYHRTSVACSHCRRRKIRCLLPTPEDPHGRCANCIRLKKECVFHPVEQPGQSELRPQGLGRRDVQSGSLVPSAVSSPRTPGMLDTGSSEDLQAQHLQFDSSIRYPPGGMNPDSLGPSFVNGGRSHVRLRRTVGLTTAATFHAPPQYGYQNVAEGEGWASPSFQARTTQTAGSSPYWTSSQSTPHSTGFPPNAVSPNIANASPVWGSPHLAVPQENQSWTSSRSASFGHLEGLPYPYSEVQRQADHPPPQLGFQFTPAPGVTTNHLASSSGAQALPQIVGPVDSASRSPYPFQQNPYLSYSNAAYSSQNQSQDPSLGSNWYPEPASALRSDEHQSSSSSYTPYFPTASMPE